MRSRTWIPAIAFSFLVSAATAQPTDRSVPTFTVDFTEVAIEPLADAVAAAYGKTLVIHPGVKGRFTLRADHPLTGAEFFSAFAQQLSVEGLVVDESADLIKVYPATAWGGWR